MVKRVKFVGIAVSDQDRALEFWTQKVGCQVATDQPMGDGQRWIELRIPGAQTGLALASSSGTRDSMIVPLTAGFADGLAIRSSASRTCEVTGEFADAGLMPSYTRRYPSSSRRAKASAWALTVALLSAGTPTRPRSRP